MKKKSKFNLLALNIFIFMGIVLLASFPNTYSRYVEVGTDYLKYNSNFVALANGQATIAKDMVVKATDEASVTFHFDFNRNSSALGTTDEYGVILDNYRCHSVINNKTTDKIAFETQNVDNEEISVDVICDTTNSYSGWLGVTAMVVERVNEATRPFGYLKYQVQRYDIPEIPKTENTVNTEEETVLTINDPSSEEAKNRLINWLNKKEIYKNYLEEITTYVNASSNIANLRGILKVNNTYDVNADFLGYARTYSENLDFSDNLTMYFSDTIKEEIFKEYLRDYLSLEEISLINNYITLQGGFNILKDIEDNFIKFENNTITLNKEIIKYISSSKTFTLARSDEMKSVFASLLKEKNIVLTDSELEKLNEAISATITEEISIVPSNYIIASQEEYILLNLEIEEDYNIINFMDINKRVSIEDGITILTINKLDTIASLNSEEIIGLLKNIFDGEVTLDLASDDCTLIFKIKEKEIIEPEVPEEPDPENSETPKEPVEPALPEEPDTPSTDESNVDESKEDEILDQIDENVEVGDSSVSNVLDDVSLSGSDNGVSSLINDVDVNLNSVSSLSIS